MATAIRTTGFNPLEIGATFHTIHPHAGRRRLDRGFNPLEIGATFHTGGITGPPASVRIRVSIP